MPGQTFINGEIMSNKKAKAKTGIDELIVMVSGKHQIAESILLAIKDGKKWSEEDFRLKFYDAPNHIPTIQKFWFPRHIQEQIGKIEKIKAVEVQPRTSGRNRAVYVSIDTWKEEHPDEEIKKPIVDIYNIHCSCGASFLGREPEHQLFCEACKNTSHTVTSSQKDEILKDQLPIILNILRARNITEDLRRKVEVKLVSLLINRGVTREDMLPHFREAGYSDEDFGAIVSA